MRPTTDMAKESLFNILRNTYDFTSVNVLDLYAGTGNISFEFASRGAPSITAVDQDAGCIRFIASTAEQLEMPIQTIKSQVTDFLNHMAATYDLIFADPPYTMSVEEFNDLAKIVFDQKLLNDKGTLIIEHSKHMQLEHSAHQETRNYGGSAFSFFSL